LKEAPKSGKEYEPEYHAKLVRQKIDRQNNFKQAGERYRMFEDWERNDLINNLVNTIGQAEKHIQDKMVELFTQCDPEYGQRVADGLKKLQGQIDKGPIGSTKSAEAVQQAEQVSKESKPY
jgi:catalase